MRKYKKKIFNIVFNYIGKNKLEKGFFIFFNLYWFKENRRSQGDKKQFLSVKGLFSWDIWVVVNSNWYISIYFKLVFLKNYFIVFDLNR